MAKKVQSDFYFEWAGFRIEATYNAAQTLDDLIEYVTVDTTAGNVPITLPDTTSVNIVNGKKVWIKNIGINHVLIVPNPADGSSIQDTSDLRLTELNEVGILELTDNIWTVQNDTFSGGIPKFIFDNSSEMVIDNNATPVVRL